MSRGKEREEGSTCFMSTLLYSADFESFPNCYHALFGHCQRQSNTLILTGQSSRDISAEGRQRGKKTAKRLGKLALVLALSKIIL